MSRMNASCQPACDRPHEPSTLSLTCCAFTCQVRGELTSEARRKVNTLIITDVHGRDIVDGFVRDSVADAADFAWESQLRFYWERGQVRGGPQLLSVTPAARGAPSTVHCGRCLSASGPRLRSTALRRGVAPTHEHRRLAPCP